MKPNQIKILIISICISFNHYAQNKYFQQKVDYKIKVELNDVQHYLYADLNLDYSNNSNDTLKFIYFHLWPNAYRNNKTALAKQLKENGELKMEFMSTNDIGWIDSLNFESNGIKLKLEIDEKNKDVAKLLLNEPLLPNQQINLHTPFRVKIPSAKLSRLGHIGQAYAITQWYPKPAVYDNKGWHPIPYLDQGEFYSEFGSFDVEITLPENYVVGATGDLFENDSEIKWLEKIVIKTKQKIQKGENLKAFNKNNDSTIEYSFPKSSISKKTLRYKQNNVHDFAWFADKRFNVLKDEVELPISKKKVTCWSLFTDNDFGLWVKSPNYLKDAIYYYSEWNGEYPYNQVTAVDGTISAGGGMEYPNVTIIGSIENALSLETFILHEVGHNWFYGILGSNERNHPWMDEGINSFNELRYIRTKFPNGKLGEQIGINKKSKLFGINELKNIYQYYLLYAASAKENNDQPIELSSEKYTEGNYGAIVYSKTAAVMDYLFHYLGDSLFDVCMKKYYEEFKFKHPQPENLRNIFETTSGKNLSWFFDELINSKNKIDYTIQSISKIKSNEDSNKRLYKLKVKNKGEISSPFLISALKEKKEIKTKWFEGFSGTREIELEMADADEFQIDSESIIPEINRSNNNIKTNGLFKKRKSLKLKFIGSIDKPSAKEINYLPIVGYNNNNGLMAGVNLSNYLVLEKKIQYDLIPLYSFGNKELAGFISSQLNFHPNNFFKTINTGIKAKRFSYEQTDIPLNYYKIEHFTNFIFKNKNQRSRIENQLKLSLAQIGIETQKTKLINDNTNYINEIQYRSIAEINFSHNNKRTLHPYEIKFHWQTGNPDEIIFNSRPFSKIWLEAKLHYSTNKRNNGFDFRIFAGKILNQINSIDARFRMGGIYGYQDYAFNYLYFDRSTTTGINAQQYIDSDGGFKTRMYVGQTNDYLISLNLKSPKLLNFIGVFADIGTCGSDGLLNDKFLADMGINFDFFNQAICVNLPLLYSNDIKSGIEANGWNFGERIMINLRIDRLNPKSYIRSIFNF